MLALEGVIKNAAGGALKVTDLEEVAAAQFPVPFAFNVNVTVPAAISAALGVQVARVSEFALLIVPAVPLDDHNTLLWLVALEPAVIFTATELEQVNTGVPATAVGAGVIVTEVVVVNMAHPPDAAIV